MENVKMMNKNQERGKKEEKLETRKLERERKS